MKPYNIILVCLPACVFACYLKSEKIQIRVLVYLIHALTEGTLGKCLVVHLSFRPCFDYLVLLLNKRGRKGEKRLGLEGRGGG